MISEAAPRVETPVARSIEPADFTTAPVASERSVAPGVPAEPQALDSSEAPESPPADFASLGLREELLRALASSGYEQPTPIQIAAIPPALAGRDLICCAQTGTGKTAAFALPILQLLSAREPASVRALVLVPTRELAVQVADSFREYGSHLGITVATIYGGVPMAPQDRALQRGVDIVVATPGRLKDHIWQGHIDFRHTRHLVLDEADRMLDMGFVKAVREIVDLLPAERQSWLFSATLDEAIRRFAGGIVRDALRVQVAPPSATLDEVDLVLVHTSRSGKRDALEGLVRRERMTRAIIFTRTKSGASRLASQLRAGGHAAAAIHSDRSQAERTRTLEAFRQGQVGLLVATDVAARGIDVDDVSHVVNYDMPHTPKDYVHRIGRTARAGRRGVAVSLVTDEDLPVVAAIERLIARRLTWLGGSPPRAAEGASESTGRSRGPRGRSSAGQGSGPRGEAGAGRRRSGSSDEAGRRSSSRSGSSDEAGRRSSSRSGSSDEARRRSSPRSGSSDGAERRPRQNEAGQGVRRAEGGQGSRRASGDSGRSAGRRTPPARPATEPEGFVRGLVKKLGLGRSRGPRR